MNEARRSEFLRTENGDYQVEEQGQSDEADYCVFHISSACTGASLTAATPLNFSHTAAYSAAKTKKATVIPTKTISFMPTTIPRRPPIT